MYWSTAHFVLFCFAQFSLTYPVAYANTRFLSEKRGSLQSLKRVPVYWLEHENQAYTDINGSCTLLRDKNDLKWNDVCQNHIECEASLGPEAVCGWDYKTPGKRICRCRAGKVCQNERWTFVSGSNFYQSTPTLITGIFLLVVILKTVLCYTFCGYF